MDIKQALQTISDLSFKEMLAMVPCHNQLEFKHTNALTFQDNAHISIMITVASSVFRVVVFLHVPALHNQKNVLTPYLHFSENQNIEQQYKDYISELSNNLSGISARMLRSSGYSTGLSQPEVLNTVSGDNELQSIHPDHIIHHTSYLQEQLAIACSYCLFINRNYDNHIDIELNDLNECIDSSGELEFF